MSLQVEYTFDDKTFRHYMNGFQVVLHSHHYMALATKMAEKFEEYGGPRILAESVEDGIRPVLDDYVQKHNVAAGEERLIIGAKFYAEMGLGNMSISGNADGGRATLTRSHVDQGWQAKFGSADKPLNHFTRGYLAAIFACAFDRPARGYEVAETASLVKGDPTSEFEIKAR